MEFHSLKALIGQPTYGLAAPEKSQAFMPAIKEVTQFHTENCKPYGTLCSKRGFNPHGASFALQELPYLPPSIFKDHLLLSVPEKDVFREINSSATTKGKPSRIGLDRHTSARQSKCFNKVVLDRLGNKRHPFVVLDIPESISRTSLVTARSSTIRSLLFSASDVNTCMVEENENLILDDRTLDSLLKQAEEQNQSIVIFGFTYILYKFVVEPLLKQNRTYALNGSKVIHIGGWKKLEAEKVSPEKLIADCCNVFGVRESDVVDFYGFTEQGGMIYPTCEYGFRHMPVWGEVLVRDPITLDVLPTGEHGLLQFITPIQTSYPGHSILTEDVGFIEGADTCRCGRKGSFFKVIGRSSVATEVRGCSDILAEKFS